VSQTVVEAVTRSRRQPITLSSVDCNNRGTPPQVAEDAQCDALYTLTVPSTTSSVCLNFCECIPTENASYECAYCCRADTGPFGTTCGRSIPRVRLGSTLAFVNVNSGCLCNAGFTGPQCQYNRIQACADQGNPSSGALSALVSSNPCEGASQTAISGPSWLFSSCETACGCTINGSFTVCTSCCRKIPQPQAPRCIVEPQRTEVSPEVYSSVSCTACVPATAAPCHVQTNSLCNSRGFVGEAIGGQFNCTCNSTEFSGPRCELSRATECNDRGNPMAFYPYSCICEGRSTGAQCLCPKFRSGSQCQSFDAAAARNAEAEQYEIFTIVSIVGGCFYMIGVVYVTMQEGGGDESMGCGGLFRSALIYADWVR
jgi:hypothetical protein